MIFTVRRFPFYSGIGARVDMLLPMMMIMRWIVYGLVQAMSILLYCTSRQYSTVLYLYSTVWLIRTPRGPVLRLVSY